MMVYPIVDYLVGENKKFLEANSGAYQKIANQQNPKALMVMCADSRTPQNVFGPDGLNYLFTVKNIGNRVYDQRDGILGDVAYPIEHLNIPLAVVCGHSDCGAIKAAVGDYSGESKGTVHALDQLKSAIDSVVCEGNDESLFSINQLTRSNIDFQIEKLMGAYADKFKSNELVAIGYFVDFDGPKGYITNINGVTDIDEIMKTSFSKLGNYFERD